MRKILLLLLIPLLFLTLFSRCSNDNTGTGILNVKLTDAPITLDNGLVVEQVNVVIKRIDVVRKGSGQENSDVIGHGDGVITVLETDTALNLLDYTEGLTALMGSVELEADEYLQLRLAVDAEASTIKFADDDTLYFLNIPSGGTSGIKIKGTWHNPLFVIEDGDNADLVFDFDAQMSIIANTDRNNYKLKPVIKEVNFKNQIIEGFETECL